MYREHSRLEQRAEHRRHDPVLRFVRDHVNGAAFGTEIPGVVCPDESRGSEPCEPAIRYELPNHGIERDT